MSNKINYENCTAGERMVIKKSLKHTYYMKDLENLPEDLIKICIKGNHKNISLIGNPSDELRQLAITARIKNTKYSSGGLSEATLIALRLSDNYTNNLPSPHITHADALYKLDEENKRVFYDKVLQSIQYASSFQLLLLMYFFTRHPQYGTQIIITMVVLMGLIIFIIPKRII